MGVTKYRSVEEMPSPPPLRPLDPENLRIAFGLMALANRLHPRRQTPGVRKFSSYDEMIGAGETETRRESRSGTTYGSPGDDRTSRAR